VAALIIPLLLLVVAIPLVVMLVRANELFCLRVSGTRVAVVRGRIPQRLLDDLADVFRAAPAEVVLRGVSEGGQARVYADGEVSEAVRQRIRNVLAQWPVVRIRNAPRPRRLH
jgi:hypothetical protein